MTVIKFEDVSKRYKLYSKGGLYMRDRLSHALRRFNPFNGHHSAQNGESNQLSPTGSHALKLGTEHALEKDFWALKNISFEINQGESVGFIGRNGAGKSTILKLLAGVTKSSSGTVEVNGRVAAMIEVGAGFHPELTGRENIYLNGSIMGMKKNEIDRDFDSIVEYAELQNFIDTPVKHYSSGMYVRLGFAIAVHTSPDIFLIDEVLAVGDEAFQKKCVKTLEEHRAAGKTMILVSHQLDKIEEVCERCIYIDHGQVRFDGDPADAIKVYRKDLAEQNKPMATTNPSYGKEVKILGVTFHGEDGAEKTTFKTGDDLVVKIRYHAFTRIVRPVIGIGIRHGPSGFVLTTMTNPASSTALDCVEGEGVMYCRTNDIPLVDGIYLLTVAIQSSDQKIIYDHHFTRYTFFVSGIAHQTGGLLAFDWSQELKIAASRQDDQRAKVKHIRSL